MIYLIIKHLHLLFVTITFILFHLRYGLIFFKPNKPLPKILRKLPHQNDTLLLITGLLLVLIGKWVPFVNAKWLGVKLLLVIIYILLGAIAIKSKPRSKQGFIAYLAATLCFGTIVYLVTHKPF